MRYQVMGPPHFGVTNLRTVHDWVIRRRLLQVHGVVAVTSSGGPTKEFQRLGIAGRDRVDDIVFGVVAMGRTYQTSRVLPQIDAVIYRMNHDGSLPTGVKVVPYYDRSDFVAVTTHTVTHNLVFGCLLVFLIQWAFLGNLRGALIAGLSIPFALLLEIIVMVARGESPIALSLGASGADSQADRAVIFSVLIIVAAFVPLFMLQGVEGAFFGPMARTYTYALTGALIATYTVTPVLASIFLPARVVESETLVVRGVHSAYDTALRFALAQRAAVVGTGLVFLALAAFCWTRLGSELMPHRDAGNVAVIVPVSLVLIPGLLYSLFNSIRQSLLSLTGIPFAVAGGVLGLYFTGRDASTAAAIGFITLFGVSAMIGIAGGMAIPRGTVIE